MRVLIRLTAPFRRLLTRVQETSWRATNFATAQPGVSSLQSQSGARHRFFQGYLKVTPAMLCCRPDGQNPLFSNEPHAGHCRGLKKFAARRLSNSLASALGATAAIGSGCGICENRVRSFRSIQLHRVSALGRKRTWQPPNLG